MDWTDKNLDVSAYRNGDPIPQVTDSDTWYNLTTGAWCWYNNDSATYAAEYGKLYNWYAVNDARGLAPAGWRIPTANEWNAMISCVNGGNTVGSASALQDSILWNASSDNEGLNYTGFSAHPSGERGLSGAFSNIGSYGYWWADLIGPDTSIAFVEMGYDNPDAYVVPSGRPKSTGHSVRCVRDASYPLLLVYTDSIKNINYTSANSGGSITLNNSSPVTSSGLVWDTLPNPTINLSTRMENGGIENTFHTSYYNTITNLQQGKKYYVRAYATNSMGVSYGNQRSFTTLDTANAFTDPRDGQVYTYRQIGTQVWMTQNLNYVTDSGSWCYNNNAANCAIYGRMYTWNAALAGP